MPRAAGFMRWPRRASSSRRPAPGRHRPLTLDTAFRTAVVTTGEYVLEEEEDLLRDYAASSNIDMAPDGFRHVSRDEVPLLGLGPLAWRRQDCRCLGWSSKNGQCAKIGGFESRAQIGAENDSRTRSGTDGPARSH